MGKKWLEVGQDQSPGGIPAKVSDHSGPGLRRGDIVEGFKEGK